MNNPGMHQEDWERIHKKVVDLAQRGHDVKVTYTRIFDGNDRSKTLLFEVTENIDGRTVSEIVQQRAGEAYETFGIAGFSMEHLVSLYKEKIKKLCRGAGGKSNAMLTVTMTPGSARSGELSGTLRNPDSDVESSVPVSCVHYYVLNAIREKMTDATGDAWKQVKAILHAGEVEFYFEY